MCKLLTLTLHMYKSEIFFASYSPELKNKGKDYKESRSVFELANDMI